MLKNFLIITLFFCLYCNSQWSLMDKTGPALLNTEPDAKPLPSAYSPMWCVSATTSQYVLTEDQMWKFELKDKRWLWQPNPTSSLKTRTKASYWNVQGIFYLFGGNDQSVDDSVWLYDLQTRAFQQQVTINSPGKCHSNVFWEHEPTNQLYLWGGYCNDQPNPNVYAYDVTTRTWRTITQSPSTIIISNMGFGTLSRANDVVYIYINDEMWEFDMTSLEWSQTPNINAPPGPNRTGMVMWRANKDDSIMLFGGISGGKVYGDTWSYSPYSKTWTITKNEGPTPRYGMSYCSNTNDYNYIFGGNGEMVTNDIWQYGPFTVQNVIDRIEWKLDSATLMATWGTAISSIVLLILTVILVLFCVRKCVERKKRKELSFTPINTSKSNYVIETSEDDNF